MDLDTAKYYGCQLAKLGNMDEPYYEIQSCIERLVRTFDPLKLLVVKIIESNSRYVDNNVLQVLANRVNVAYKYKLIFCPGVIYMEENILKSRITSAQTIHVLIAIMLKELSEQQIQPIDFMFTSFNKELFINYNLDEYYQDEILLNIIANTYNTMDPVMKEEITNCNMQYKNYPRKNVIPEPIFDCWIKYFYPETSLI